MRNILYALLLLLGLWACSDNDENLGIMPTKEGISFEPVAGGAVMRYTLPEEQELYAIKASYTNAQGERVTKKGSYSGDSLLLDGFNEAKSGIPVRISYQDRFRNESEALELTFDTEDSAPYTFITKAEVKPSWYGFQVMYDAPEVVTGMGHVFYLRTNELNEVDTVLLRSFTIARGGDTLVFDIPENVKKNTVVLQVDDFKGHSVGKRIFEDVESYEAVKLDVPKENWDFSEMPVLEKDEWKFGVEYLFDGDFKGERRFNSERDGAYYYHKYYTFRAGPNALDKPFYVDLGAKKIPAFVRIYGMQNFSNVRPITGGEATTLGSIMMMYYGSKLPCNVTVYGRSNDSEAWKKIGTYSANENLTEKERWYYNEQIKTEKELQAADSLFMDVKIDASEKTYRYLKVVVNKVFYFESQLSAGGSSNKSEYVSMHELEVYVKKD